MNHQIRENFSANCSTIFKYSDIESIAILDMIEAPDDEIGFIVMEEWSPQLINGSPCCLRLFLGAMQQCIDVGLNYHFFKGVL